MEVLNAYFMTFVFTKILYALAVLIIVFNGSFGDKTYRMEDYCYGELNFILKSIYQAKLQLTDKYLIEKSDTYYPYSSLGYCETTVEAWYTYFNKLMFYFENLDLDCDKGHLEFYDGEDQYRRVVGLSYDICGQVKPVGIYKVDSRHLRIKYVPKRRQYFSDLFSLVITSFGDDDSCPSYGHECGNARCINEEVACNGYNSCGDDTGCDLERGEIIGIVVGCIVGVGLIISIVVCCICCNRRSRGAAGTVQRTAASPQAVTYTGLQSTSQAGYGMSQGSPHPTDMTYMAATTANAIITNPNQPSSMPQNYNFNQNTNYQPNQERYYVPSEAHSHVDPSAPPPSYEEIMANSRKT